MQYDLHIDRVVPSKLTSYISPSRTDDLGVLRLGRAGKSSSGQGVFTEPPQVTITKGTITLIQSVEYFPTQYSLWKGGKRGKGFQ